MRPIIIVNFKTAKSAIGKRALKLAKICDGIAKKTKTKILVAVQIADIYRVVQSVKIGVLAEHVDFEKPDSHTGMILPEDIKENGAMGSLLNHSEHRLKIDVLKKTIERCKKIKLKTIVCVASVEEAKKIAKFKPDYLAFEIPSLIGTLRSVSKMRPREVKKFVEVVRKINSKIVPLCGAGVANGEDVRVALELGTKGILVASAVNKAKNPRKVLLDLVNFK